MPGRRQVLYSYGFQRLDSMLEKGNVWYVRHYERYFDEVHVIYLRGDKKRLTQGTTHLVSLGSSSRWLDLLFAPWRLSRYVSAHGPGVLITADLVFGWWTSVLLIVAGRKVALMPVCMPEELYRDQGRSLSGLPIWLERLFTRWSFAAASCVVVPRGFGAFLQWLETDRRASAKLLVTDTLPEMLPTNGFLERVGSRWPVCRADGAMTLIYVGRLHREKLVYDLLEMMRYLCDRGEDGKGIRLRLVGDGPERAALEARAIELGVADCVEFVGAVPNEQLPDYLFSSDVFVSPLTGAALREAAACGLPIVAYDRDWVKGFLRDGVDALLVPSRDVISLGNAVIRLKRDTALRKALGTSARELAARSWMPDRLRDSLRAVSRALGEGG